MLKRNIYNNYQKKNTIDPRWFYISQNLTRCMTSPGLLRDKNNVKVLKISKYKNLKNTNAISQLFTNDVVGVKRANVKLKSIYNSDI